MDEEIALPGGVPETLGQVARDDPLLAQDLEDVGVIGRWTSRLLGGDLRAEIDADLDR